MKNILLILVCINLSCTTTSQKQTSGRNEISALTGSSIEFVREQWGKADEEITKGKKKTLKYTNISFKNTDIINRKTDTEICTVWLETDDQGTITSWDKTDCKK